MFGNKTLLIEDIQVNIDSRFRALDGLRILHFSDLHLTGQNKQFDNFFAKLSKVECDLAIVSGDMIDNDNGIDACIRYLSGLKPRYGTFVTYGNHDRYQLGLKEFLFFKSVNKLIPNNLDILCQKLKENNISILINEIAHLDISGIRLELIGLDGPFGFDRFYDGKRFKNEMAELRNLIARAIPGSYTILISHVPDIIRELDISNVRLILSSHTHGGQIRLPFFGPLITVSSFEKKYNRGVFRYNGSCLHVSSGLGMTRTTPIRLGCPPSATVMTLKNNGQV